MAFANLTPEQQDLIKRVEANKQAAQVPVQPQLSVAVNNLTEQLAPIQEALQAIHDKPLPDMPDYAQPVVEAVDRLQEAVTGALKAINVKPEFKPNIQVAPPNVSVNAPKVDTGGIEQILRKDVPKAFKDAISGIPKTEIPEDDYTPIIDKLNELSEKLSSIDLATRIKPQAPNTVKVTNPDGTVIGGGSGGSTTIADGADVAEGTTADSAVIAGSAGTISGKLRQISSDISKVAANTFSNSTLAGNNTATSADGTQLVSLAGPTGDPVDTINDSLSVQVKNTGSVTPGDPNQQSQIVAGARKEQGFSTTIARALDAVDVSNYRWVSLHILTQGTNASLSWQQSNDGVNWVALSLVPQSNTGSAVGAIASSGAAAIFSGPINARYFRLSVASITAGVTSGVLEFFTIPGSNIQSTSNVANVSSTPADGIATSTSLFVESFNELFNGTTFDRQRSVVPATSTTGIGILATGAMGIYNAAPPNLADKTFAPLQTDNNANLKVTLPAGRILQTDKTTIDGETPATSAPGTQLVSLAGPTGDPVGTTGDMLNIYQPVYRAPNPVLVNISSSTTSTLLLGSNPSRLGALFFNDSTAVLYLSYGTSASTTSYTTQIAAGGLFELPPTPIYSGPISGVWASANGAVRCTEVW